MASITGNLIFEDQLWQSRTSYSAAIFGPGLLMAAIIGPPRPHIARTSYQMTVLIKLKNNSANKDPFPILVTYVYRRSYLYIGTPIYT